MGKKRVNYDPANKTKDCVSCVKPRLTWTAGLRVNEEDTVQICHPCLVELRAMNTLQISATLFKRIACKQFNFPGSLPRVEHNDGCVPWEFMLDMRKERSELVRGKEQHTIQREVGAGSR